VDATDRKTDTQSLTPWSHAHTRREKERGKEARTSRDTTAATTGRCSLWMLRLETPVDVTNMTAHNPMHATGSIAVVVLKLQPG